ncbi:hypothetical protein [Streptosporangium longisporum]|uniref:hypothetical protein n=1 Tax=Streptosporangium longisporum TaxID=46187 RepID=UPI003CD067A6
MTKAALYYHFKTKDDIVLSLAEDRSRTIGELVSGRGAAAHRGDRRSWSALLPDLKQGRHRQIIRFSSATRPRSRTTRSWRGREHISSWSTSWSIRTTSHHPAAEQDGPVRPALRLVRDARRDARDDEVEAVPPWEVGRARTSSGR